MLDAQSVGGLYDKSAFEYDGWSGLGGIRDYLDRGYVPQELGGGPLNGGAGQTLEYSFQDWTLAQLARRLGKRGINVAQFAKATASSGTAARAIDGRPARSGDVRWVPTDDHPWVQLDWSQPQQVTRVVRHRPRHAALQRRHVDGGQGRRERGQPARELGALRGSGLGDIEVYDDRDVAALPRRALAQLAQPVRPFDRVHPAEEPRRLVADAVRPALARGLRRGQRLAGVVVHLARRDGAGEPDGRRGGLRRQAQLRVRERQGLQLHRRLRRRLRQLRQPARAGERAPVQLRRLPVADAALGAPGQGEDLRRDHHHRRLRALRRGPGPDGRHERADGDGAVRGHRRRAGGAGL